MTASLYATSALAYAAAHAALHGGSTVTEPVVTHAVSRPVIDGLTASECGQLVDAVANRDWRDVAGTDKCPECERLAG